MGRRLTLVPLHLLALAVMCAPVAVVAYSTGATDESCYEMQVIHVDSFSGVAADPVDCVEPCQFSLSLVSVMASETNQTIVGGNETDVYQCGRVYECKALNEERSTKYTHIIWEAIPLQVYSGRRTRFRNVGWW